MAWYFPDVYIRNGLQWNFLILTPLGQIFSWRSSLTRCDTTSHCVISSLASSIACTKNTHHREHSQFLHYLTQILYKPLTTTPFSTSLVMDGRIFSSKSTPTLVNIHGRAFSSGRNRIRNVMSTFCKSGREEFEENLKYHYISEHAIHNAHVRDN